MLGHHLCLSIVLWLSFFRGGLAWTPHEQCSSSQKARLTEWMKEAKSIYYRGSKTLAEVMNDYKANGILQPPYEELFTALLGPQPKPTDWRDFYDKMRTVTNGMDNADILIRCSDPAIEVKAKWHPDDRVATPKWMHPVDLSRIGITRIPNDLKEKMERPDIKPWFPNDKQIYVDVGEASENHIAYTLTGSDFDKQIRYLTSVTNRKTKQIVQYGENHGDWSDIIIPVGTWKENRAESWYPDFSAAWNDPIKVPWLERQYDSTTAKSQPLVETLMHEMLHTYLVDIKGHLKAPGAPGKTQLKDANKIYQIVYLAVTKRRAQNPALNVQTIVEVAKAMCMPWLKSHGDLTQPESWRGYAEWNKVVIEQKDSTGKMVQVKKIAIPRWMLPVDYKVEADERIDIYNKMDGLHTWSLLPKRVMHVLRGGPRSFELTKLDVPTAQPGKGKAVEKGKGTEQNPASSSKDKGKEQNPASSSKDKSKTQQNDPGKSSSGGTSKLQPPPPPPPDEKAKKKSGGISRIFGKNKGGG